MQTFVKAEIWTIARTDQGNAVLIRPIGSEIAVPIFIGQLETQSILIGFGDVVVPRPLTHDLMLSILQRLQVELLRIEITDLKEGTFYARLVLHGDLIGPGDFTIDCRPSDALALAVRKKCPVYIAEQVVDEAGVSVNLIVDAATANASPEEQEEPIPAQDKRQGSMQHGGPPLSMDKEAEKQALREELQRAIAEENYERAAQIRDMLAALEN
ncbi:MAG: bifunctional nuclease family protein [Treponemataceae bacterium]|nr:bifunctional nuclease family protein [Treponemataceae bacterium]